MATTPDLPEPSFDMREQAVRIDQMIADIDRKLAAAMKARPEIRFAPIALIFTGMGAAAAFFAAGIASARLFVN